MQNNYTFVKIMTSNIARKSFVLSLAYNLLCRLMNKGLQKIISDRRQRKIMLS